MTCTAICTIKGTITKADGSPMAGQQVTAVIKSTEQDQGGQIANGYGVTSDAIEAFTDGDGSFCIDLIQGAIVLFSIPAINLRKEIVVPVTSTADFSSLI